MLRADLEKVYIEHCVGCNGHKWCTNHDEAKYATYFSSCKTAILRICPQVTVVENQVPLGFQNKFITDSTISQFGKFHFPRIGSFEVYFRGVLVFSKIQSMKWPLPINVANKVKDMQETPSNNNTKKKFKPKRLKSAMPSKKKSKKPRKRLNRFNAKSGNDYYEDEDEQEIKTKLQTKTKTKHKNKDKNKNKNQNNSNDHYQKEVADIYRHNEIPNFSVDMSDSEQPVPPQDYFKMQSKPQVKEPAQITREKQEAPHKKSPTPDKKIQNELEIAAKKTVTPPNLDNFDSKYKRHSESPNNYTSSDDYNEYSDEEMHDFKNLPETKPGNLRKMDQHEDLQYRKQSSSESSGDYPTDKDKFKYNPNQSYGKEEKSDSDSDDYGSDYNKEDSNSADNSSQHIKNGAGSEKEESDYKEEEYEEESEDKEKDSGPLPGKNFSEMLGKKDSSEEYSDDKKSDDYAGLEFEEEYQEDYQEEEEVHPLRKVDKSYNVKLPLAEESKKKITYQNMSNADAVFAIESSHPDFMNVKEEEITIEKGKKGKIQLRFAPIFNDEEKKFYLYVDKDGEPWECIEIIAEYQE